MGSGNIPYQHSILPIAIPDNTLTYPCLSVDMSTGDLYVCETGRNTVRKLVYPFTGPFNGSATVVVSTMITVAGTPGIAGMESYIHFVPCLYSILYTFCPLSLQYIVASNLYISFLSPIIST